MDNSEKPAGATSALGSPRGWLRPDVLAASLTINMFSLALPIVVLQVYDRIIPNQAHGSFAVLIVALLVTVAIDALLRILRSVILSWSGAKFEHRQSMRLLHRILSADTLTYESSPPGSYLDRFQNLDKIQEFYSGQSILLLVDLPFIPVFLILIWLIAGNMVLIPATLLLLFLSVSLVTGARVRTAMQERITMDERRQNFIIETLRGVHTIKSMAMEELMMRRHERLQAQSANSVYELARINSIAQGLGATFSQVATVCFVGIGSILVVGGDLTVGALAAGTMLSGRTLQPTLRAMGLWSSFQGARLARDQVERVLALPPESGRDRGRRPSLEVPIKLENVSFRYPGQQTDLIEALNLTVQPNEAIGIAGANGVGKSTLLALLMGFFHPREGRISFGRDDLRDIDPDYLHGRIGYMPQKGSLFEGTILENMTLFRGGHMIHDAVALTRELGLDEIIARLPDGLDTKVGSAAVDPLSEGARQAILMVRAMVGDPPVLFFDDANANFDLKNDTRLLKFIERRKGKRTIIIVSHRPSFLRLCDRQFVLRDRRLQELQVPANRAVDLRMLHRTA
jgi:ATP-binding cassette subfamily C protein LapB